MQIQRAPRKEIVLELLADARLPTAGLTDELLEQFFSCGTPGKPDGVIGLEVSGPYGLLRSLVVAGTSRGRGCGRALVQAIEGYAESRGVEYIYLLTETADTFFEALGYTNVDRSEVPRPIRETEEFASLCPASARVMHKKLAGDR